MKRRDKRSLWSGAGGAKERREGVEWGAGGGRVHLEKFK